jgi:hypothetical protein
MLKGKRNTTMYCDKCKVKIDEDWTVLTVDGGDGGEWVDLCAECWKEFKRFLGRETA